MKTLLGLSLILGTIVYTLFHLNATGSWLPIGAVSATLLGVIFIEYTPSKKSG